MQIETGASLLDRNTFALPATAAALAVVRDGSQLRDALSWALAQGLSVVPLGQGSNVVLAGDLEALVVSQSTRGVRVLEQDETSVLLAVAAGQDWHALVEWCLAGGYHGLENLALIPGSAGAAPIQNIGAYGVELETCLERVHAVKIADGASLTLAREECGFGYRDSVFKNALRDQVVITGIELRLAREPIVHTGYPTLANCLSQRGIDQATPHEVFDAVVSIRRSKLPDPVSQPNAGSFFKNPVLAETRARKLQAKFPGLPGWDRGQGEVKLPAAWLIDHCGWKGASRGAVGVHKDHALVLVNRGGGTGAQLMELAGDIARSVRDTFGLELEIEPRVLGTLA